jgi:chemotaxis protein CheC
MSLNDVTLNETEIDALTELVNIAISRAAVSLRKMVGTQVLLSVPALDVVTLSVAVALMGQQESDPLVAVRQDFQGAFAGQALLILPETTCSNLVRAIAGEMLDATEEAALKEEALVETGNVILSCCLSVIGNLLTLPFTLSLPKVLYGDGSSIFGYNSEVGEGGIVLFLYIDFSVEERSIRGYVAMIMDLPSLAMLKNIVGEFVARVTADSNWTVGT